MWSKAISHIVHRMLPPWLLTVFVLTARSQSFRVISTGDGLPQSFVSGLVQDDSSFVWIATRNGLARFDGVQYKIFQHVPGDSTSLSSNLLIWLEKDAANRIWIEHETGEIDGFDPVSEHITHLLRGNRPERNGIRFMRRGWLVDRTGRFWGGTKDGQVTAFPTKILLDPNGKIIGRFTGTATDPGQKDGLAEKLKEVLGA
jgi:ligand-binding sensor domain-containing protein